MQERVGLQAVTTDGEFRRTASSARCCSRASTASAKSSVETDFSFSYADGSTRRATPVPKVTVRLRRSRKHGGG